MHPPFHITTQVCKTLSWALLRALALSPAASTPASRQGQLTAVPPVPAVPTRLPTETVHPPIPHRLALQQPQLDQAAPADHTPHKRYKALA